MGSQPISLNWVEEYIWGQKSGKIVFKVIEAHKKWKNSLNWINGYLDLEINPQKILLIKH